MTTEIPSRQSASPNFEPEEELLILVTRPGSPEGPRLQKLCTPQLDWGRVVRLAHAHGVVVPLYQALANAETGAPAAVVEQLGTRSSEITKQSLGATRELVQILQSFETAGIDALPYRGPVLATEVYGEPGLRQFSDLDILVRRADIQRAKTVLLEAGYEPRYELAETEQLSATQEWAYTNLTRDYPFFNPETQTHVELHWRILELNFPTAIGLETVWDRRTTTTLGGHDIPTLSAEDRLLTLCIHGSKHYWRRLMWICDIARVIDACELDWDSVVDRARQHNAEGLFLLGPALARTLYGTELPDSIVRLIGGDGKLEGLVNSVLDQLFITDSLDPLKQYRFQRALLTRFQDQARLLTLGFLMPRRLEIELVSLPFPLLWLYFLIRPARAVGVRFGVIED